MVGEDVEKIFKKIKERFGEMKDWKRR